MNIKDNGRSIDPVDNTLYHEYIIALNVLDIQESINKGNTNKKIEELTEQFKMFLKEKLQ